MFVLLGFFFSSLFLNKHLFKKNRGKNVMSFVFDSGRRQILKSCHLPTLSVTIARSNFRIFIKSWEGSSVTGKILSTPTSSSAV